MIPWKEFRWSIDFPPEACHDRPLLDVVTWGLLIVFARHNSLSGASRRRRGCRGKRNEQEVRHTEGIIPTRFPRDAAEFYFLGSAINTGAMIGADCSGTLFQASIALLQYAAS
jgi:hypothetical protein